MSTDTETEALCRKVGKMLSDILPSENFNFVFMLVDDQPNSQCAMIASGNVENIINRLQHSIEILRGDQLSPGLVVDKKEIGGEE